MGLPCCHYFAYARVHNVHKFPDTVVLPRWLEETTRRVVRHVPRPRQLHGWDALMGVEQVTTTEGEDEMSAFLQVWRTHADTLQRRGQLGELRQIVQGMAQKTGGAGAQGHRLIPAPMDPEGYSSFLPWRMVV
jgi:hypothetical protein